MTEAELTAWGRQVGAEIGLPAVITLSGPLGAGKSVLARAIAQGAGVTEPMPSPTFNLSFEYRAERRAARVQHMDLYRLNHPEEVWELGWSELGGRGWLVLIEWPERAGQLLPPDRWELTLAEVPGSDLQRTIAAVRVGAAPDLPPLP